MFLLACLVTLVLVSVGDLVGMQIVRLVGLPPAIGEEDLARIVQGQIDLQQVTGAPDYLSFSSLYLVFSGIWVVFALGWPSSLQAGRC